MAYKGEKALLKYAKRVYAHDPELRDAYLGREMERRKRGNKKAREQEARARAGKDLQYALRYGRQSGDNGA